MEALKLAFDTIIVGALVLPWLAVVIDLFLASRERQMAGLMAFLKTGENSVPPAVTGVLLFAMAYFLGAAVSRVSGDFFNDDDLHVPFTEDNIRTAVFCDEDQKPYVDIGIALWAEAGLAAANRSFADHCSDPRINQITWRISHVQESALLLLGSDKTEMLNQLHAQISVLRGAAFNGLVMFVLCVFGLGGKQTGKLRTVWWLVPGILALGGFYSLGHHLSSHRSLGDPPFMEFTLLVLGLTGLFVLWKGAPQRAYGSGLLLAFLLTGIALFGWWWTEVLYNRMVLYSFYALNHNLPGPLLPGK